MSLLNKISLVSSVLALSISSVNAGKWFDLLGTDKNEATLRACSRYDHYKQIESSIQLEKIANYVDNHLPHLSSDIVRVGVNNFFDKKKSKWLMRATDPWDCAVEIIDSDLDMENLHDFIYYSEERGSKILLNACRVSEDILFRKEVIKILEKTANHATKLDLMPDSFVYDVNNLIKILKVSDKEVQRLQKVHTVLNEKIFDLMSVNTDLLSWPFNGKSTVCITEQRFNKHLKREEGWDIPYPRGCSGGTYDWKEGEPLNLALPWSHGDKMAQLIKVFSPHSKIRRVTSSLETYHHCFSSSEQDSTPIVFNCSWAQNDASQYLRKKGQDIHLVDKCSLKDSLKSRFFNDNCDGPLKTQHVEFLQWGEKEIFQKEPYYALKLVEGANGNQDHLLIAAANNTNGSLVKEEFHDGRISLLDGMPDDRSLVALNWNFTTDALDSDSKSAGEYKDMAVVVPAAYISVADEADPVPSICVGGHSAATAILSAVISQMRGMYPELTRKEVRAAILKGANKKFPGYTEELHGQGMLNLIGAIDKATVIMSSPNRKRPLPTPPIKNEVVEKKIIPNSNRPLPTPQIKKGVGTKIIPSNRPLPALPVQKGKVNPN